MTAIQEWNDRLHAISTTTVERKRYRGTVLYTILLDCFPMGLPVCWLDPDAPVEERRKQGAVCGHNPWSGEVGLVVVRTDKGKQYEVEPMNICRSTMAAVTEVYCGTE